MKAFPWGHNQAIDGMDLRDYFAASALQGILACEYSVNEEPAVLAYQYADEMMKAREAK
jgi:hypothetical protein